MCVLEKKKIFNFFNNVLKIHFKKRRKGAGQPEGSRHLVFMTYLNDVSDAGGTEFYHQGLVVQPVKGLTLLWPSDWCVFFFFSFNFNFYIFTFF